MPSIVKATLPSKQILYGDAYKVTGKGVRLAVISDSYDNKGGATNDILLQDLPGLVIQKHTIQTAK